MTTFASNNVLNWENIRFIGIKLKQVVLTILQIHRLLAITYIGKRKKRIYIHTHYTYVLKGGKFVNSPTARRTYSRIMVLPAHSSSIQWWLWTDGQQIERVEEGCGDWYTQESVSRCHTNHQFVQWRLAHFFAQNCAFFSEVYETF